MSFNPANPRTEDFILRSGEITKRGDHQNKGDSGEEPPKPEISEKEDIEEQINTLVQDIPFPESDDNKYIPESSAQWKAYEDVKQTPPDKDEGPVLGPDGKQVPTLSRKEAEREKAQAFKLKHPERYMR